MSCNHKLNYHNYMTAITDFEYAVGVPTLTWDDTSAVGLYIAKAGGGTKGKAYAGAWYYRLDVDGKTIAHGDDLRTGTPKSHAEVARIAADFLARDFPEDSPMAQRLAAYADDPAN